jgi:hypothetical protein
MQKAEHLAIPSPRVFDIGHGLGDLADAADGEVWRDVCRPFSQRAIPVYAVPVPKLGMAGKAELLERVADVDLAGVDADAEPPGDHVIGQVMAHGLGHPPLGRRQKIIVGRPPTAPVGAHGSNLQPVPRNYPSRPRTGRHTYGASTGLSISPATIAAP